MTGAAPGGGGFLEFFILEAGDYVEQLDGVLLGSGGATGPDTDAMQRVARALRGAATMAKIPAFADLAGGVERVGRALQDGSLRWEPALSGALVSAVDDLKLLLRAARSWGTSEEQRAAKRAAELAGYAPPRQTGAGASAAPFPPAQSGAFLATEASNIAAGLELLTTRAGDPDTASNVLRRVRALRGVAGVKEVGPLADTLEATEDAARGLESGEEEMSGEARQLLESAASYMRTLASALRGDGDVNAPSSARDAFTAALDNWSSRTTEREHVVPISDLFYGDDSPGLVQESPNPPTSTAHRFRLELVSLGEHLRQIVDSARRAGDVASTTRVRRDLKKALRALQAAAVSFGRTEVATFIADHLDAADHLDFLGLAALEDLGAILTDPGAEEQRLIARLRDIAGKRDLSSAIAMGFSGELPAVEPHAPASAVPARHSSPLAVATPAFESPVVPPAPEPRPVAAETNVSHPAQAVPAPPRISTPARPRPIIPEVSALDNTSAALIDSSIAALDALNFTPFSEPTALPEDEIVPIEVLLYSGRAALDRAVEVRDEMKRSGARDGEALEELFDLLELARAE